MKLQGPFEAGKSIHASITPTVADPEVAKLFSFRWHPFAIQEGVDYSKEPTTLIEFVLADHPEGTHLTITESGFDQIPIERRAEAFEANEGGWQMQTELIAKYLEMVA
jgi:hypothetical protein